MFAGFAAAGAFFAERRRTEKNGFSGETIRKGGHKRKKRAYNGSMEKKRIFWFCLAGFAFVSVIGALSHFFYEWSGYNRAAGLFFAANESTWEHLKLAIFPTLVFFLAGMVFLPEDNCIVAFFAALALPMLLIPALFYAYTAIAGRSFLAADIAIYFISVFAAFAAAYGILLLPPLKKGWNIAALAGIAVVIVCYMTFTLFPPEIFLFRDPLTGGYGLRA